MRLLWILLAFAATLSAQRTALVVAADQTDWVLGAGGTIANLAEDGFQVHLLRVANDEKDAWELSPEEAAVRARQENEAAAKILGVAEVHSLGYRSGELAGVQHTELRDRILFYIRKYKPQVLFIPNPYAEYVEALDRFYVGKAAEDAWRSGRAGERAAGFANVGLEAHVVDEVYYYAQPVDPRRREPNRPRRSCRTNGPRDIAASIAKKTRAAQALKTANESMAQRIKQRLDESGRRLPLLDAVNAPSINELVAINVTKLAEMAARDSAYEQAEEFHYAGIEFQIPKKYLE